MTLWITCLFAFFHTTTFAADAPMCIRYKGSDLYERYETRRRQSFGFMFDWNKHNLDPYLCTAEYIQIVYTTYDLCKLFCTVPTTPTPTATTPKAPLTSDVFSTEKSSKATTATMTRTSSGTTSPTVSYTSATSTMKLSSTTPEPLTSTRSTTNVTSYTTGSATTEKNATTSSTQLTTKTTTSESTAPSLATALTTFGSSAANGSKAANATAKVATITTPSLNATKSPAFKFSTTTDTRALTSTMASTSLDSSSSAASSSPTIANVTGQPTTIEDPITIVIYSNGTIAINDVTWRSKHYCFKHYYRQGLIYDENTRKKEAMQINKKTYILLSIPTCLYLSMENFSKHYEVREMVPS
ncbi:unnamed protein product [Cylicocyclus nassatus]|uniref:Uncharacterized protein n=1 Tax=Cylicocyclus nassatus TaxID=53992 RepID=A0AA36GMA6_CYLNA|nr:unnamed protein product [Cylicocyclus nassatus]